MATRARLAVALLATAMSAGCATPAAIEAGPAQAKNAAATPPTAISTPATANQTQRTAAAPAPSSAATPEPPAAAPNQAAPSDPAPASPERQLAVLRVEAGALVTRVNGDPKLACTRRDCRIPLPPGTHQLTIGYKDTETRAGSTVTYASMHSRVIEVTLEPGHTYSVTASGRYTPRWWIAVEDQTANKTVYNDREISAR